MRSAAIVLGLAAALILATIIIPPERKPAKAPLDPPIVLISDSGPPEQLNWVIGKENVGQVIAAPDTPFSFSIKSRPDNYVAFLELRPDVPWQSYRLEAEVRHDAGAQSSVGIYFARCKVKSLKGTYHCFGGLGFADEGVRKGQVSMDIGLLRPGMHDHQAIVAAYALPTFHFPPLGPEINPKPWRRLAVEVTPEEIPGFLGRSIDRKRFYGLNSAQEGRNRPS